MTAKQTVKAAAKDPHTWIYLTAYGAGIAGLVVPEVVAIKNGGGNTISGFLRRFFHTDSRNGRTVWLAVIGVFGALFAGHIMGSGETDWR